MVRWIGIVSYKNALKVQEKKGGAWPRQPLPYHSFKGHENYLVVQILLLHVVSLIVLHV